MLFRRVSVRTVTKCLLQNQKGSATTTMVPRFLLTCAEKNSKFVASMQIRRTSTDMDSIQKWNATTSPATLYTEADDFNASFPGFVDELCEIVSQYDSNGIVSDWYRKALYYNLPHGKKYRGLTLVSTYKQLVDKSQLTTENIRKAHYLAWCLEMVQGALLIYDDIMDQSTSRRGQPCWYRVEDVGVMCINDGLMIENGLFQILRKHFSDKAYYSVLVDFFRKAVFATVAAQCYDVRMSKACVTEFTMPKYRKLVDYKMSFYSLYFPVAVPMIMNGNTDPKKHRQVGAVLGEIGFYYQSQNDFWDCFGKPSLTGKVGTDIEENKLTWLATTCIERATDEQKAIMKECHGKKDPAKIARVKQLYKEIGIPRIFDEFEKESYKNTRRMIEQLDVGVPHKVFYNIMDTIYLKNNPELARSVNEL